MAGVQRLVRKMVSAIRKSILFPTLLSFDRAAHGFRLNSIRVGRGTRAMAKSQQKLDVAMTMREEGRHEEALAAFKKLEKDSHVGDAARYEQALLLYSLGRHKEGDVYSAQLGFKYRLNNVIFEGGLKESSRCNGNKSVRVFDNLISAELLAALRSVFGQNSDFWHKHDYPTDRFFSYNLSICDGGRPLKKHCTGRNGAKAGKRALGTDALVLMRQLADCLLPAAKTVFADPDSSASSAEWWAHCRRGCGSGHQLHFDLDELRVRDAAEGEKLPHPLASCVVFLEGSGGPTLLTDLSVHDAPAAAADAAGLLCPPAPGRVLVFDGGLLHGVCPTASFDALAPRTTLMMGLWADGVRTTGQAADAPLAPNMTSVPVCRAGEWTAVCQRGAATASRSSGAISTIMASPAAVLIPCGPIWTRISARGRSGKDGGGESLTEVGRFMLRDDPSCVRGLCIGTIDSPHAALPSAGSSGPRMQTITLEELRRLRGES